MSCFSICIQNKVNQVVIMKMTDILINHLLSKKYYFETVISRMIFQIVQNENFVENRSNEPVMNENDDELEQNQEGTGDTFENHRFRKEKNSLKGKRRKFRKMRCVKRNHGEEYQTEKGKTIAARKLKPLGNCRKKCNERFNESDRQCIFDEYWSLGSHSQRMTFMSSLITSDEKKSEKRKIQDIEKQKIRILSYKYFLKINGKLHEICSLFFKYF